MNSSVIMLRGVNVGGHRTFRPSVLAQALRRYDLVNIGAAGTFVARKPPSQTTLRGEIARHLPFETGIMICPGRDLLRLVWADPFATERATAGVVHFVSLLARRCSPSSPLPQTFPPGAVWGLRLLGQQDRFVFGVYRREMRAINHLAQVDRIFGVPSTARSWGTILKVADAING